MNTQKYYDDRAKDIRERWFPKHVAQFGDMTNDGMCKMTWSQPGTSNYATVYIISKRHLIVYGDIGEAVYGWAQDLTWDWLAGLNLSYFAGKCEASEHGRRYDDWDAGVAKICLLERIAEIKAMDVEDRAKHYAKELERLEELEYSLETNRDAFKAAAQDIYDETGDGELAGSIGEMGEVTDMRCQAHLIGLQMAWAQYQEAQKKLPTLEEVQAASQPNCSTDAEMIKCPHMKEVSAITDMQGESYVCQKPGCSKRYRLNYDEMA